MTRRVKRRQELELDIDKVAFGGKGIGYVDDYVVFVENTLPGDRVKVRVRKARKNYAEAYPLEILRPSPLRREAPCPHFGYCGGCKWQNVDYDRQLIFKKAHVEESLLHIGNVQPQVLHDPIPSREIFGYRNKMEFSFSDNRWLTPEELKNPELKKGYALGFHVPRHYDRILEVSECLLQSAVMNRVFTFSKEFFREAGAPVYNPHTKEGLLRYLVLRQSFARNEVMVNLVTTASIPEVMQKFAAGLSEHCPEVSSVFNAVNSRLAQIAQGEEYHLIRGKPNLVEQLGRFQFEISPESFFQTNSLQAETLYQVVEQFAEPQGKRIWDLYSGAGSIAIFLAAQAKEVLGFEIVENAVKDAYRNAELNKIDNCRFIAGDLRFQLEKHAQQPPEVLICDPPRAGMHKEVLKAIRALQPQRIVYVSCNPATMARDLIELTGDYQVVEVQPVDMFPHTYHIESVAKLIRK